MLQYVLAVLYGLVFGIANIIPGVSGGTMLVVFGCYDKVCGALSLNFKEIKKNIVFLIFFGIGAVIGLVGFSFVITWLFENFPTETYMFFMGLIVGSTPLIIRNATVREKFRPICALPFVLALVLVVGLAVLEGASGEAAAAAQVSGIGAVALYLIAGFVAAVAMIIPGVSGSFIMVLFGTYQPVIAAIKALDFAILIPTAIGVIAGLVLGARLISMLMKRFRLMVFSAILGLVAGSLYAIFPPDFGLNTHTFIGVIALAAGFAAAFIVGRHTKTEEA
ncbi:MAG: DUF368 domain-containing protein [Ruminiclostridium sp.]|nr:DUF368 domain-containing protein [Ruminiclostridium sp.]